MYDSGIRYIDLAHTIVCGVVFHEQNDKVVDLVLMWSWRRRQSLLTQILETHLNLVLTQCGDLVLQGIEIVCH